MTVWYWYREKFSDYSDFLTSTFMEKIYYLDYLLKNANKQMLKKSFAIAFCGILRNFLRSSLSLHCDHLYVLSIQNIIIIFV